MRNVKIEINNGSVYRNFGDLTFIENTECKLVLQGVANEIWSMIKQHYSCEDMVSRLYDDYDVEKSILETDLDETINNLYKKRIIKIDGELCERDLDSYYQKEIGDNRLENFYGHLNFLYKVVLEVTYKCNNRCEYCYNGEHKDPFILSTEKIKNIIDECRELGVMKLCLIGGEPFVREDIMEIIRYAHQKELFIVLQTNGTLISEEIAQELAHYQPISASVTVHSSDSNIHDNFTKTPGSFLKSINGIKMLTRYGIPVLLKNVVTSKNYHKVEEYAEMARQLNVRYNFSPLLYPVVDGSLEPLKFRLSREQVKELIDNNYYHPQEDPCGAGVKKVVISPIGKVYPCPFGHFEMGDCNETSLGNIIHSEKAKSISQLFNVPETCQKCEMSKDCPRCPIITYYEKGGFNNITEFNCMIAEIYRRKEA